MSPRPPARAEPAPPAPASLRDVAEAAGVSVRTASRALAGEKYVRGATRETVLAAARRVGYRRNHAARALRTGRTKHIGAFFGAFHEYNMKALQAFEARLHEHGFCAQIVFCAHGPDSRGEEARRVDELLARRPEAVAVFPHTGQDVGRLAAALRDAGAPHVFLDADLPGTSCLVLDRAAGVEEAVHYLADAGRERIAYLGSTIDRTRLAGYRRALTALGRPPRVTEANLPGEATPAETAYALARQATEAMLAESPQADRPDALVVYSDAMAMGVLAELAEHRIRVPERIAVVGFGDRSFAALAAPPLTTVHHPYDEAGARMATRLLEGLEGTASPSREVLPSRLVVRASA